MKAGFLTMTSIGAYGRAANMFFQVAAILGIAKRNNLEPVFAPLVNADHRDRFGSTEDVDLYRHFVYPLPAIPPGIQWNAERPVPWGYHEISLPPGNWNLSGHFQSPKYFDNCRDQVAHYFKMKDEPPQSEYVALHFRGADYDGGYHPRMSMDYYGPAMAMFPDSQFLIFSDSMEEAKRMFGDRVEYSEGLDYIQDFKRMKRCRDFIIGNSSYSAFASLLGEHPQKRIVAPAPWFGPKYTQITGDDIYDKDWTVIDYSKTAQP